MNPQGVAVGNMGKAILKDTLGDQAFSLKDVDFAKLD
jgi:hypothetical protein